MSHSLTNSESPSLCSSNMLMYSSIRYRSLECCLGRFTICRVAWQFLTIWRSGFCSEKVPRSDLYRSKYVESNQVSPPFRSHRASSASPLPPWAALLPSSMIFVSSSSGSLQVVLSLYLTRNLLRIAFPTMTSCSLLIVSTFNWCTKVTSPSIRSSR